ncbi:hypothetical protein [Huintestinicola sp.]|uniref:hypothetical protein n=1 Tax=Huintestinicola sp. TaxID=2981661 RepID=UPI003D7D8801
MKKLTAFIALAAVMTLLTACGGGETSVDRAESALESAQNAIGEAADSKASQLAEAAVGDMEIPDENGETELPDVDELIDK